MNCLGCAKEVKQSRKGYCGTCYARIRRNGTLEYAQINKRLGIRRCSFCNSESGPFVKTLCKPCYYRDKKNGTLEYQRVPKFCTVPKCEEIAVAHGLCDRHRKRVERNGDLASRRPEDWGAKASHPMYEAYKSMIRAAKVSGGFDQTWNDFWKFIDDVGEKPNARYRLYRIDKTRPYQRDNVEWRAQSTDLTLSDNASRSEYQRIYRLKYPDRAKHADLKKMYGVSLAQFNELLEKQDHRCAICRKPEGAIDPYTKKARKLALDHCHATMRARGLLCTNCNTGLGRFYDDIELMQRAIDYLRKSTA